MNWKTETIYSSPIPVSAEQLPQQRVTEVIEMPDRPEDLVTYSEFIDYYPDYPVRLPEKHFSWVVLNGDVSNAFKN